MTFCRALQPRSNRQLLVMAKGIINLLEVERLEGMDLEM